MAINNSTFDFSGGFGVDFANNVTDVQSGLRTVATGLLKYGVTSFCPTLVTSTPEVYHKILPQISRTAGGDGANILGVHLEGPFISKDKKGAHHMESIQELSNVRTPLQRHLNIYTKDDASCRNINASYSYYHREYQPCMRHTVDWITSPL